MPAIGPLLGLLKSAGPLVVKWGPTLVPFLQDEKFRQRLIDSGKDLLSRSPTKRLRARLNVTAALADQLANDPDSSEEDQARAAVWGKRAKNLSVRLDMPVIGRKQRSEHRRSIREQVDQLHADMNEYLGEPQPQHS